MIKKYKLIKEYPNSKALGTISWTEKGVTKFINNNGSEGWFSSTKIEHEKFPEFWEEIVGKTYEILSLIYLDNIYTRNGTTFRNGLGSIEEETFEDNILRGVEIHSVKRLSDGEIFTIGDKIKGYKADKKPFIINKLEINKEYNTITLIGEDKFESRSTFLTNSVNSYHIAIKVKQPLFVTEDGVEIFEGDKYFFIHNWKVNSKTCLSKGTYNKLINYYFSTEEAAKQYILENKPCLSYKEVMKLSSNWDTWNTEYLQNLIKSRL